MCGLIAIEIGRQVLG